MSSSPFDRMLKRCLKRLGVATTYIREGSETPVEGIFDDDYQSVDMEGNAPVTSRTTKVGYHKGDLPFEPRKGDMVRVNEQLYRVVEAQPDSEFGITLILRKV